MRESHAVITFTGHQAQHTQFTGGTVSGTPTTISLAPVSGANPIVVGMPLALPVPAPVFARAAILPVKRDGHACAISHQYFLAAGQPHLVAFWSTAPAVGHTPVTLPAPERAHLQLLFGQPGLQVYAVPISLVDPTNPVSAATIPPVALGEVALTVTLVPAKGIYTGVQVTPAAPGAQPSPTFQANLDTGASYSVIRSEVAEFLGLAKQEDAHVIIPRIDFQNVHPALSLLNVPAVVTRDLGFDQLTLGSSLFDHFSQVVFDLGAPAGSLIRLLP